jgi:superoxide dismutase, Fe-Mn family
MPFELPRLPYAYDALEPHIDARTMEIHHTKHHQAYIDKANAALKGTPWESRSVEEIIQKLDQLPQDKHTAVRNNAGGHANHSLFWKVMKKGGGGAPGGDLAKAIDQHLGGFEKFKDEFTQAAMNRFGSGWAWLVLLKSGELAVTSTANQDNPLMGTVATVCQGTPLLGLDVWEHAYYLKYQNKRPDYVAAFWNVVNWDQVAENFRAAPR